MLITLILLSAGLSLYYGIFATMRPVSIWRSIAKTGAILCLAFIALLQGGPVLLIAALGLSALGDYFLSRETDATFLAGMAAFFAAHLAYIPLFLVLGDSDLIPVRWVPAVALAIFAGAFYTYLWPGLGAFRLPVAAYSLAIASMGVSALGLATNGAQALILAGAGLFVVSDSILGAGKFRLDPETGLGAVAPYLVWATYWSAQALITLGVLTN